MPNRSEPIEPVLVTGAEWDKARAVFQSADGLAVASVAADEASLAAAIGAAGCRAVVLGAAPYRGPLYEALGRCGGPRGAIIARFGVGVDGIDKAQARRHGIVLTNTRGALERSVAEHAIWLMGCVCRKIPSSDAAIRSGTFAAITGIELFGKTLAVLGFGAIGTQAARIAALGLGMKVIAVDCLPEQDVAKRHGKTVADLKKTYGLDALTTDVDAALAQADAVSVHLPGTGQTRNFLDAARLARMKAGAILVNTSRGAVVDEAALYDALASGRLGGAGLDVFAAEPYRPAAVGKDLRTLANVVLTPHLGSNTVEANRRMAVLCLDNIRRFFAADLPADRICT